MTCPGPISVLTEGLRLLPGPEGPWETDPDPGAISGEDAPPPGASETGPCVLWPGETLTVSGPDEAGVLPAPGAFAEPDPGVTEASPGEEAPPGVTDVLPGEGRFSEDSVGLSDAEAGSAAVTGISEVLDPVSDAVGLVLTSEGEEEEPVPGPAELPPGYTVTFPPGWEAPSEAVSEGRVSEVPDRETGVSLSRAPDGRMAFPSSSVG